MNSPGFLLLVLIEASVGLSSKYINVCRRSCIPFIIQYEWKLLPSVDSVQIAVQQLSQYLGDHVMGMKADNWCFLLC